MSVITAWQCISPEVTMKGFKKCCTRCVQKKDRTFAIKTLLLILQHFKHCPLQSNPLYW